MLLTDAQSKLLGEFAASLAFEGGRIAKQWFRAEFTVEQKEDKSPVTIADRKVEAVLREKINLTFPDHGILGEEYGQEKTDAEFVWVIDPIDGTRSFVSGSPLWGTLVALLHNGIPIIGAVEMPILEERWLAMPGKTTQTETRDAGQKPCTTSACTSLEEAIFYTTSMRYFDQVDKPLIQNLTNTVKQPLFGGDCYIYGLLSSGYIDLVVESQLKPFDFLSLVPVIEQAGGCITDWQGKALGLNSEGNVLAAANPTLHQEALQFLQNTINR